uniref:Carboxypeptidase n=1 Tax=Hanusia phi TaxID=3032 RepID=A0A7S0HHT4_9CRYP
MLAAMLAAMAGIAAGKGDDEVKRLPGWKGPLPSRWFSGYIDIDDTMRAHYVYVERETPPSSSSHNEPLPPPPLLLWSNGGPGASSMFGLMTEIGPFMLSAESLKSKFFRRTHIPSLIRNPFAWTRFADILIFDSPPPVGFSYCYPAGPAGRGDSCGAWNDTKTALVNYQALKGFFNLYPHLRVRRLFLAGESYAGVYIPTLAREILQGQQEFAINLRGFAVGDACAGTDVLCGDSFGPLWEVEWLQGHQQFSRKLYEEMQQTCGYEELKLGNLSSRCQLLIGRMEEEVGGYYEYALYDDCVYDDAFQLWSWHALPGYARRRGRRMYVGGALNDYPCGTGRALMLWVGSNKVRKALHVPSSSFFFNADNGDGFSYLLTEKSLLPLYSAIAAGRWGRVQMLVYNGDTDPSINTLAAQNWTSALKLPEIESWRPWTLDGCRRMGGYVTRYAGSLDFLTIRGAGHMVPTYKPAAAFAMMSLWLEDLPFPAFNSSCTQPPETGRRKTQSTTIA